jgi:colicin import membrane protein
LRPGFAISGSAHALVLGWGLIHFAVAPLEAPRTPAMPVDLVPLSELTELKAGTLKKLEPEAQKPAVEKVAEAKPVPVPEAKPTEKPEVKPTAAAPPPPPPEVDSIPELIDKMVKPEPAPAPKPEQARVPEPPKRPPIPKQKPKPPEATADARTPERTFDPNRVAALLDRRTPQRERTTGTELSRTATLGVPTGLAQRLTQSEIDALRAQIQACWNPPVGAEDAEKLIVRLRIQFRVDGTLSHEPVLQNRGDSPYFRVAAEAAMRAVRRCAPYTLPAHKYEVWKDVEVTFDPRDMFRG